MRFIHKVTAWKRTGTQPDGQPTWDNPVVSDARWEDNDQLTITTDGRTARSRAVVYLDKTLGQGWRIKFGNHTDSNPPDDALEIREYREVPNLTGTRVEKRAVL